jgi:protein-L-isoaspartate(D-aspartate) O-methyltransferase
MTLAALADSPTLNMVQGQISPGGVTDDVVLDAFLAYDRAAFVPADVKARANVDDNVCDAQGNLLLLRPLTFALMVQELVAQPGRGQIAVFGDATGYAVTILNEIGFAALPVADEGALQAGAPWQAVLINGAVTALPDYLFDHLEEDGTVLAVVRAPDETVGSIQIVSRISGPYELGQAGAPYAPGFAPAVGFAL